MSVAPYPSLEAALADESTVDWDRDAARGRAVMLAFAATELRDHLASGGIGASVHASVTTAPGPAVMIALREQLHIAEVDYDALGDQGYAIVPREGGIYIAANTSVGALYGTYRLLGLLGFAWHDPFETLVPDATALRETRTWQRIQEVPRVSRRGFWVYEAYPLPDAFAIWLARNRFNLSGPARPGLQQKLGLHGWGGGHDLLQQEFSRSGLFEQHPEWYSIIDGVRRPVAPSGNYVNPAFGNPGAADYFASRLIERLERGDLRNIDVLNVWPADDRFNPFDQSAEAVAIGNPTDNLLTFYGRVASRFREAAAAGTLSRTVSLAGISYFQTMQPPTNAAAMRVLESAEYFHVFYPIDRSWSGPVDDPTASRTVNQRLMATLANWRGLAAFKYGVVDYHNVSTFAAVAVTDLPHLQANLRTFTAGNTGLYGSMHPLLHNPGPRRLTNSILSQLLWQSTAQDGQANTYPDAEPLIREFFESRYGAYAAEWRSVHETMARSVDNAREMFGVNSLFWLLHQDLIWSPAFYRTAEVVDFIPRFRTGGSQDLPAAYSQVDFERAEFRGLNASIAMHQQAQVQWEAILPRSTPDAIRSRMEADVAWFASTASRYRLMAATCDYVLLAANGEDATQARERMRQEIQFLATSGVTKDTISPVDQRAFLDMHRTRAGIQ